MKDIIQLKKQFVLKSIDNHYSTEPNKNYKESPLQSPLNLSKIVKVKDSNIFPSKNTIETEKVSSLKYSYSPYSYKDYLIQKQIQPSKLSIRGDYGSDKWHRDHEKLNKIKVYEGEIKKINLLSPKKSKYYEEWNELYKKRLEKINSTRSKCIKYGEIVRIRYQEEL